MRLRTQESPGDAIQQRPRIMRQAIAAPCDVLVGADEREARLVQRRQPLLARAQHGEWDASGRACIGEGTRITGFAVRDQQGVAEAEMIV